MEASLISIPSHSLPEPLFTASGYTSSTFFVLHHHPVPTNKQQQAPQSPEILALSAESWFACPNSTMFLTSCHWRCKYDRKPQAAIARTKLYSIHDQDGLRRSSLVANGGICKSMVETRGYHCHEHKVTTKDGYILSMQRIPAGRSGKAADKPPVLLQHGLIMDGASWLVTSPNQSLALMLADNGFDVWITSVRGTKYSRGHISLTPDDQTYWDWTWDQLVAYDLPAFVRHVHNQTGKKLHYVGHSLGTLTVLAALSQKKLLKMLRSAALLSPIAHTEHVGSLILRVAADIFLANDLYWLGVYEFVPGGDAVEELLEHLCETPGVNCNDLVSAITGPNCCVKASTLDIFLKHEPHPSSTKNFIHLSQMIRSGTIEKYDYSDQNMKKYGQMTPPFYNLTNIPKNFPLFLSYGGMDYLSNTRDVQSLLEILQSHNSDKLVVQFVKDYAHLDFIIGENANHVVYNPVMAFLEKK